MGRKKKNKTKTKLVSPLPLEPRVSTKCELNKKKVEANSNLNAAQTDKPELSISCRWGGRNWGLAAQGGVGSRSVCSQINNCASFCNVPEEWLLFPDFSCSASLFHSWLYYLNGFDAAENVRAGKGGIRGKACRRKIFFNPVPNECGPQDATIRMVSLKIIKEWIFGQFVALAWNLFVYGWGVICWLSRIATSRTDGRVVPSGRKFFRAAANVAENWTTKWHGFRGGFIQWLRENIHLSNLFIWSNIVNNSLIILTES